MTTTADGLEFVTVPLTFVTARLAAGKEYSPAVYWLALSRTRRDGHAHFATGELAGMLGMRSSNATRAVQGAVDAGWLHPDSLTSRLRCIRLPQGHGHGFGVPPGPCGLHRRRQKDSPAEPSGRENPRINDSPAEPPKTHPLSTSLRDSNGSAGSPIDSSPAVDFTEPTTTLPLVATLIPDDEAATETRTTGRQRRPTFDDFWTAYPVKRGRPDARRAWLEASRKAHPAVIVDAARAHAADPNRADRFTKHPANWLRGECWHDDPLPDRSKPLYSADPQGDILRAEMARARATDAARAVDPLAQFMNPNRQIGA